MAYTTINKSTDYFDTKLWVANQTQRDITGFNFNPDWVWIHNRTQSVNSMLFDKVRGATKQLHTNTNGAENTDAQALNAFISNGFSLGTGWTNQSTNDNYVSWNWSAGNSAGSSNTDGTITSTVSVNSTSKMSIVTYSGNGTAGATIGHGLGVIPKIIVVKNKTHAGGNWVVYHASLGNTKATYWDLYDSAGTAGAWNNTSPTSSVFTVNDANALNGTGGRQYVAYCFADVKGYQKCGEYTGNANTDGTFVYTGFKPAMMWFKRTSGAVANWQMWDNKRDTDNPVENAYHIDSNDADGSPDQDIDFLSNGFKVRSNQGHLNADGVKFIYYAVAEAPLVGSNNVPCTAR